MRFLTLYLSLIALNLFGQETPKNIQFTTDSDTAFWARYHLPDIEKLKLLNPYSGNDFFRVSSAKYFIELSQLSNKIFFWVNEIWDGKQTGETYIKSFELPPEKVMRINFLIDSLEINKIPSDKYISGWTYGFDGITYIFEYKKANDYSFKKYWTPSIQSNSKDAEVILNFTTQLDEIIEFSTKNKLFQNEIPFYAWTHHGASTMVARVISKNEYRKYKRKKKSQLKSLE